MKKLVLLLAMVALTFNLNAQTYKVKMVDGNVMIYKMTLTVTNTTITFESKFSKEVYEVEFVSDDGYLSIYTGLVNGNKTRFTMINSKPRVLKLETIDSFTNAVTTTVWLIKLIN
tara:strand:+ start:1939 stop:2283 length:345 start_codon:yes stop_codon:yes gene_type:complete